MSFFSKLLDNIFGSPVSDADLMDFVAQHRREVEAQMLARQAASIPVLQEPIGWPQADAARLPSTEANQASRMPAAIAEEIRGEVQQARARRESTSCEIRFQRGGTPSVPPDPLFSDVYRDCKPRAFTDRLRQGVREVYGGDAVPFYRAAGITRSAYSRLISHPERHPSKDTALAMAAALKLDEAGATEFLELAGYALSPSYPEDAVWRVCFRRGIHDLATIRAFLEQV